MGRITQKINKEIVYGILALGGIIILCVSITNMRSQHARADRTKCPYKIEGNLASNFTIRYVDSPYCLWCWLEEPVLKKLVNEKGDSFKLERYDLDYCSELIGKYKVSGTPSFVFSIDNGSKEYAHSGFISGENFNKIICEVTGNCI